MDKTSCSLHGTGSLNMRVYLGEPVLTEIVTTESFFTILVRILIYSLLSVYIQKSTAFGNYTNNTPLSVASGATPLVLTFA